MQGLPLKKLRNFGGKLGAELQSMGATTAGEVRRASYWQPLFGHAGSKCTGA